MLAKKIISTFLAVLMLGSACTLTLSATEEETEVFTPEYNTSSATPTIYYMQGLVDPKDDAKNPKSAKIEKPEDKLATMDLRMVKDGYELYVDAYSGEVAVRSVETGECLFTNPYNMGAAQATTSIKLQLMSQLVIKYKDITLGDENTYYSGEWTVGRGIDTKSTDGTTLENKKIQASQLVVKNIKNGLRVEYTIGREQSKMLVPQMIEKTAFETKILNVMKESMTNDEDGYSEEDDFIYNKLNSYYALKDLDAQVSQAAKDELKKSFPITEKMAVYVLDSSTSQNEKARVEQYIKTYCPNYTYEELDEDHLKVEYESEDENPPLFKMALEYTLDSQGLSVRLPANGIRFNEALYELLSIEILPYMGAGANPNPGYTFFPDGSGTLFDFEKIAALGTSTTVTGKVYGQDYAYHTITGTHQEIIRYPVFGICETQTFNMPAASEGGTEGGTTSTATEETPKTYTKDRGFVAIVEEGNALMELSSFHAVRTSVYNTVKMTVYPRPQDTYNVADAISVGQNDTWTVVSSRKYTGNYKIRYMLLTDANVAKEKGINDYYECSYVGMAKAYRQYLEGKGVLSRLTKDDVKEDIPLYIETLGALETTEKFLSIPVDVMTPLTTFKDIDTMYDDLSAEGIKNINFIMTGYTKGGLTSPKVPYNLKWESADKKGGMDFEDLTASAKNKGFGIFPDFDFVFVTGDYAFDGLSLKKHAVKTIDNRYTSKREYSATKQTYISYFELALSPAYFSHFYEKFTKNYLKYDPIGISVSTLGSYLNSDFDEDEPYNREDSRKFTEQAFAYLDEHYNKVMTSGGNAYSWKYVDYITDIALDSSRYSQSAASVPFLGMVLHGYVEIAGSPINMEGNIEYSMLKAIENGAALKFLLSYRNTENLKDWVTLSKYYSVRYDIWFDDVVSYYNEINAVLKDLQTSLIVDHRFVEGTRVPDMDELEADAKAAVEAALRTEEALRRAKDEAIRIQIRDARVNNPLFTSNVISAIDVSNPSAIVNAFDVLNEYASKIEILKNLDSLKSAVDTAAANLAAAVAAEDAARVALEALRAGEDQFQIRLAAFLAADKAVEDAIASKNTATEKYNEELATLNGMTEGSDEYTAQKAIVDAAEAQKTSAEQAYTKAVEDLDKASDARDALLPNHQAFEDQSAVVVEKKALTAEAETQKTDAENAYNDALKAEQELAGLYGAAKTMLTNVQTLIDNYDAMVAGYELIVANNAYTEGIRNELKQNLDNAKAAYDELCTYGARIFEIADKAYATVLAAFPETTYTTFEEYLAQEQETSDDKTEDTETSVENTDSKYQSDDNKIVYMAYENGTAFLLNFNDYSVSVQLDNGVIYVLEAYGYIVLKSEN